NSMQACSCDFRCPCIPGNAPTPATHDFCKVALTFAIQSGRFGDVALDGVRFVFLAQSKAIMSEGGWIGGLIVDASATDAQAEAVTAIASGAAGGPLAMFAPLLAELRGVAGPPLPLVKDGRNVSVKVEGKLDPRLTRIEGLTVAGDGTVADKPFHPANKRLSLATAVRNVSDAFGIKWTGAADRTNGHFAPFDWQGEAA